MPGSKKAARANTIAATSDQNRPVPARSRSFEARDFGCVFPMGAGYGRNARVFAGLERGNLRRARKAAADNTDTNRFLIAQFVRLYAMLASMRVLN